jgi:hypothetical protein
LVIRKFAHEQFATAIAFLANCGFTHHTPLEGEGGSRRLTGEGYVDEVLICSCGAPLIRRMRGTFSLEGRRGDSAK